MIIQVRIYMREYGGKGLLTVGGMPYNNAIGVCHSLGCSKFVVCSR